MILAEITSMTSSLPAGATESGTRLILSRAALASGTDEIGLSAGNPGVLAGRMAGGELQPLVQGRASVRKAWSIRSASPVLPSLSVQVRMAAVTAATAAAAMTWVSSASAS